MDLIIKVKDIKGVCPVYKVGDSFKLEDGYKLISHIPLCMHSLASLLPYYNALKISKPPEWGLSGKGKDGEKAYVQCLDPVDYTGGGTVIFEITKQNKPTND